MENQQNDKTPFESGRTGSGSSTQTGRSREEQTSQYTELSQEERDAIAQSAGLSPDAIADINDLGIAAGRDDQAGGSGDQMDTQNTGEPTERQENNG